MDTRTGEIKSLDGKEAKKLLGELYGKKIRVPNIIPVKEDDMTEKQKELMHVSKFDNRSTLGKKFTESRQVRRRKERELEKKRRKAR